MAYASVSITGNLTTDPELRFTKGGTANCAFAVAENRKMKEDEQTHFFDVVAWGSLAENVAESLSKGMRVVVVGRLDQNRWEDKEGGKRSRVVITADAVGPDLRWAVAQVTRTETR